VIRPLLAEELNSILVRSGSGERLETAEADVPWLGRVLTWLNGKNGLDSRHLDAMIRPRPEIRLSTLLPLTKSIRAASAETGGSTHFVLGYRMYSVLR
jgi:hypothetical protein